jgi:hypothetical protein
MRAIVLLLLGSAVAHAQPRCTLTGTPWLEGRVGRARVARAVDARLGEEIEVFVAAPGRLDGRAVVFGAAPGRTPFARCGDARVTWRRVEPRMQHTETRAPNGDVKVYANAVVFGEKHGQWIGFDSLEYVETPLEATGPLLRVRDAAPTDALLHREGPTRALGTMRLAATVELGGVARSTFGKEDAPGGLISARVFRYSFRDGDGFLGWLGSFYNVPYLFGSAGKGANAQAERYVGADCADVLVAALRRAGRRELEYTSVAGLVDKLDRVAPAVEVKAGGAPTSLRWGRDVRPGDLLALDYVGDDGQLPRDWDHIVVLVEDRGPGGKPDGLLGPEDLVADSGDARALKLDALSDQGHVRAQPLRARGVPVL